ncbi:MAG TPA: prenyltransferase/squalene oxidase repeat-containing protein [Planctomycetaceae bacterium]|nr:prenyltransferase/squalene oxidase repeat-containing protein [Planctomycetaceae bacterium]
MSDTPYLVRLAERLAGGLRHFPPERAQRHRAFVLSQQQPDGGFRGREGDADLYYTSFAVRCLGLLGGLAREEGDPIGAFLKSHAWRKLGTVDLLNYVYTALALQTFCGLDLFANEPPEWSQELADRLERVRTADGGYAKSEQGAAGSTYHSFLTVLTYELLGIPIPLPNRLIQFFYDRQRDDGGFVEIEPMKRSGTNPTAAAAASLQILNAMDDDIRKDIKHFLIDIKSTDGGFQANTRIPFPDGLSTFTGLLTLLELDIPVESVIDPTAIKHFVTDKEFGLELPTGGFRGASWDLNADVEYTFYGLGILALLGSM